MRKISVLITCLIFLSACKQGSSSTSTNQGDDKSPPPSINIQAQDFQLNMSVGETKNVVLAHYVTSNADKSLVLTKIEPMAGHLTKCNLQQEGARITIEATQTGLCAYRYTYNYPSNKPDNDTQASGYNFITVQAKSDLPFINLPTTASIIRALSPGHEPLTIDLASELNDFPSSNTKNTTLEEVLLFGDGRITKDKEQSKITYYDGKTGHARIIYTLKVIDIEDPSKVSYVLGAIEIIVSDSLNYSLSLNSYEYLKPTAVGQPPQYIHEEESISIDVSQAILDEGEKITDDSDIRILHVLSLDADASIKLNNQGETTRSFNFKADTSGIYHVAVTIQDSQGAFASGIITVRVNGFFPLIVANNIIFSPPITQSTADHFNLKLYDYAEDNTVPENTIIMGIFDFELAQDYCAAQRMKLPSIAQLQSINNSDWEQWPLTKAYYSADANSNNSTVQMLKVNKPQPENPNQNLVTDKVEVSLNSFDNIGYVTCITGS